jgi:hypothetical protein
MHRRSLLAALTAAGALGAVAVPASAHAAVVRQPYRCVFNNETVPIAGAGFTPGSFVRSGKSITLAGSPQVTPGGTFATKFQASSIRNRFRAKRLNIAVVDSAGVVARTHTHKIAAPYRFHLNVNGKPSGHVKWHFAGWPKRHHAIFAHIIHHHHVVATHKFGKPKGPCGVRTGRARRLPVRHYHYGVYTIQVDQHRRFKGHRKAKARTKVKIYRKFI